MKHKLSTRVAAAVADGPRVHRRRLWQRRRVRLEQRRAAARPATPETKAKVGVILPDTASSARWENADRPFLGEAFEAAGVESDIQNANGDKAKFATIADQMLNSGANVLLIVNLDSPVGGRGDRQGQAAGRAGHRL